MEAGGRPSKVRKLDNPSIESISYLSRTQPEVSTSAQTGETLDAPKLGANNDAEDNSGEDVVAGTHSVAEDEAQETAPQISKTQLKKLRRRQEWDAGKEGRKAKRKEKTKERKERKRAESQAKKSSEGASSTVQSTHRQRTPHVRLPITIIVDCGFNELMTGKELISISSQLTRCHSDNSRAPYRVHLAFSTFQGKLKDRFDGVLDGQYKRWKGVTTTGEDFVHVAEEAKAWMQGPSTDKIEGPLLRTDHGSDSGEIVYLTADSEETLTELKPYSTYIIGGIVDRNRHKGICFKRAVERGIKTAKLPISDYLQLTSHTVLTTNHVNEIMVRWLELGDWAEAFTSVMPKRKGGALKTPEEGSSRTQELDVEGAQEAAKGDMDECTSETS
ncbi:MAG: hypothetical protein MMC23_001675 [Stictis urceolatum]|nr:hypothetical protein [Stictis urceolata]